MKLESENKNHHTEVKENVRYFLDVSYILIKSLPKPKSSTKPKTLSWSKIYQNLTVYLYHRSPAQPVNCRPHYWASLCRHPCVDQVEHFHFLFFIYEYIFSFPCSIVHHDDVNLVEEEHCHSSFVFDNEE